MSLRWIHENLEPPNCDEECSDIDDSCSDDSYDSDVVLGGDDNANYNNNNNNNNNNNSSEQSNRNDTGESERAKRENTKPLTTAVAVSQFRNEELKSEAPENGPSGSLGWGPQRVVVTDPVYQTSKVKLFCRTGYFIGITSSGRAKGFPTDSTNDIHVRLVICPVSYGIVRLQSAETGHYLAFNCTGHLYGESKAKKDNTEWEQWNIGNYDAFRSHKHAEAGWWLGIKRNGRHKSGPRTAWGQKAVQFLSIRLA